jgi:hypothetical protein
MSATVSRWLDRPIFYTIITPVLVMLGAGTTIAAPMLLDAAKFGQFALLMSVYQYTCDFDLGLARLTDRLLQNADVSVQATTQALLQARLLVALPTVIASILLGLLYGPLATLSGLAGVLIMQTNGPMAIYRARSLIRSYVSAALLTQFGLTLPRLLGLLLGGVSGCVFTMFGWYAMSAAIINVPPLRQGFRRLCLADLLNMTRQSWPLFVMNSAWVLYLLSGRWISSLLSDPIALGQFSFASNLSLVATGVLSNVGATYYPRHLSERNPPRLCHELCVLIGLLAGGALAGVPACYFLLAYVFPHFDGAQSITAAVGFSAVPLGLAVWVVPMVMATSLRPIRDGVIICGSGMALQATLMVLLAHVAGLTGQAWACVPTAVSLLGVLLKRVVEHRLLTARAAIAIWMATVVLEMAYAVIWEAVW